MASPGENPKTRTASALVWRIAAFVLAALLAFAALVAFGFGRCHDDGGFCAEEFSSTHVEAYASAAVLAALAAVTAGLTLSRRPLPLVAAALSVAGIVAVVAAWLESTS